MFFHNVPIDRSECLDLVQEKMCHPELDQAHETFLTFG